MSSADSLMILAFSKHLFLMLKVPQEQSSFKNTLQEIARNKCNGALAHFTFSCVCVCVYVS